MNQPKNDNKHIKSAALDKDRNVCSVINKVYNFGVIDVMDIKAEKLELIQAILNIEEGGLLIEIKNLIDSWGEDWFDGLTEEQRESVDQAIAEADRGEGISHEEALKKLGL